MNEEKYDLKISEPNDNSEIIFCSENIWIMKINRKNGIVFNRNVFKDKTPDEFAMSVIEILENQFNVIFKRKDE